MTPFWRLIRAGEQTYLQRAESALRQQAERILPFADGKFSPSPPPAALEQLTDELIVLAKEVIGSVGASIGVNARFRLLGWVVADLRGAQVVMEPALVGAHNRQAARAAGAVRA